jgi:hypothetical protein
VRITPCYIQICGAARNPYRLVGSRASFERQCLAIHGGRHNEDSMTHTDLLP